MNYEKPQVTDMGTLVELTKGGGSLGFEDGSAKHIDTNVLGAVGLSAGLLP